MIIILKEIHFFFFLASLQDQQLERPKYGLLEKKKFPFLQVQKIKFAKDSNFWFYIQF